MIHLLLEELESMHAHQNITICIDFQQITINRVEPEATHWKRWIVLELQNFLRVAHVNQTCLYQIESERFQLRRLVFCDNKVKMSCSCRDKFY